MASVAPAAAAWPWPSRSCSRTSGAPERVRRSVARGLEARNQHLAQRELGRRRADERERKGRLQHVVSRRSGAARPAEARVGERGGLKLTVGGRQVSAKMVAAMWHRGRANLQIAAAGGRVFERDAAALADVDAIFGGVGAAGVLPLVVEGRVGGAVAVGAAERPLHVHLVAAAVVLAQR